CEPVVDYQMIVFPALVVAGEGPGPLGGAQLRQHRQRVQLVGGVARMLEMRRDTGDVFAASTARQVAEGGIAQRPATGEFGRRRIGTFDLVALVEIAQDRL